jgi:hypothetical protein
MLTMSLQPDDVILDKPDIGLKGRRLLTYYSNEYTGQ